MLSGLRDEEEMALHLPAADISHQSRRSLKKKTETKLISIHLMSRLLGASSRVSDGNLIF